MTSSFFFKRLLVFTCNTSNLPFQVGSDVSGQVSPQTDADQVDRTQGRPLLLQSKGQVRSSCGSKPPTRTLLAKPRLHDEDEGGQVVGRLSGVGDGGEVVEVGGASVPVHHDDVHVVLLGQQLHDVLDPDGGRAGGPVAVDDEGGGPGGVEERLLPQALVPELPAAVQVGAGVEQQAHGQAGSEEAVGQVQVGEVVT